MAGDAKNNGLKKEFVLYCLLISGTIFTLNKGKERLTEKEHKKNTREHEIKGQGDLVNLMISRGVWES